MALTEVKWWKALTYVADSSDIRKGLNYWIEGHVLEVDCPYPGRYVAQVAGSRGRSYEVEIIGDDVDDLDCYCSCPQFEVADMCKHIVAVVVELLDAGKLTLPGYEVPAIPSDRRLATSSASGDNDTVFDGRFLQDGPDRIIPSILTALPVASENSPSARLGLSQPARLWFTLALADAGGQPMDGIAVLIWNSLQNKNGTWREPHLISEDPDKFLSSHMLPSEDRKLLQLLAAHRDNGKPAQTSQPPWRPYRHYYHPGELMYSDPEQFVREHGVLLPNDVSGDVLRALARHERSYVNLDLEDVWSPEENEPLEWGNGKLKFGIAVEGPESGRWRIRAQWTLKQESEAASRLDIGGDIEWLGNRRFAYHQGRLFETEFTEEARHWLPVFRETDEVFLPQSEIGAFRQWLWGVAGGALADRLPEELGRPPRRGLTPRPAVDFQMESADVLVLPRFYYGDFPVDLDDPVSVYDSANDLLIVRDLDRETDYLYELVQKAYRFPGVRMQTFPEAMSVPASCISKLARSLEGWEITFSGKPVCRPGTFQIEVTSNLDWFDLQASCDYGGVAVPLPRLLRAIRQGERTIQLEDGRQGLVPEDIDPALKRLVDMSIGEEGETLRFGSSQALLIDALLAERGDVMTDAGYRRVCERLKQFKGVRPQREPRGFQGKLRPYQKQGLGWLLFLNEMGLGGCLADDMGLGKTVQVLALLQHQKLRRRGEENAPSLVVVPKSLVFNWIDEAQRFTPRMKVLNYTGVSRKAHRDSFNEYDLIVTTYGIVRRDIEWLSEQDFDYVILDESTAIKNGSSLISKSVRLLKAQHRLAMTGTPIENHLGELWSLFEFLNPGLLGQASRFRSMSKELSEEETLTWLRRAVAPYILRRTKEEVLDDLPPKTEQTLVCELSPKERRQYNELRKYYQSMLSKRIKEKGLKQAKIHVLEALLRLRQAACHPGLLDKKQKGASSAKVETLLEQLEEVISEGHKALVFSQFTSMLGIVRDQLDSRGITYEYLDGRTRKRKEKVDRFQKDADCSVFLISLKAGGHGLNLTAADYVFILDPWWNPAVEAQAVDRAHRIGQQKRVFAYRLIAKDTVEEKVVQLQEQKRELAEAIVASNGSLMSRLTAEDLQLLLS